MRTHHFFILPGVTAAMKARGVPAARPVLIVGRGTHRPGCSCGDTVR